ncbi:cyclophane-forming radical SAM/SPASM peptide maturase YhhB [Marinobacter sp. M5B]|uniref:cyclophane-forming radical SAM/SPASM peptide maturase YhhB n=1 Tax=Marinobacter sp. M5B TaxID=3141535 RepID=UPI0036D2104C
MDAAIFSSFLVKVASRCNLDCDYCYVYHHADQSWRSMPKFLSEEHKQAFSRRLSDYATECGLNHCVVILHGGEPLLAGAKTLADFAELLRSNCSIPVDVSIQTNGLLLTEEALAILSKADIGVSLSLDGPKTANDKHRLTHNRRSSFEQTEQALKRLQSYPSIFAGVIAVIDPSTDPLDLFQYFDQFNIPRLDFLLPDAHWLRQPPGRDQDPALYEQWLVRAFDIWFDQYAHISLRTFEALLDMSAGLQSGTDAFGFGDVSLLSIETDGTYHDLDVLKVTQDGATRLFGSVLDTPISDVARSAPVQEHRKYLRKDGLSKTCQSCEIVDICGGGSLPHRFGDNGFVNPTVYCNEMKRLIAHIDSRLQAHLATETEENESKPLPDWFNLEQYELAETGKDPMNWLCRGAQNDATACLRKALSFFAHDDKAKQLQSVDDEVFDAVSMHPGTIAWSNAVIAKQHGHALLTVDGQPIEVTADYLYVLLERARSCETEHLLEAGRDDLWLRAPFGHAISFESQALSIEGRDLVNHAMEIIRSWRPDLAAEIKKACSAIQFVRDPTADPRKIVSFSDNSVPGALYVSIWQGDQLIDPYDLADSLIHEHRHQKLYLLERYAPTTVQSSALVVSPWREDLRPPSGLLHAVFVFVELRRFWLHVMRCGPAEMNSRAINQIVDTDNHLHQAFATLDECLFTEVGQSLVSVLKRAAIEGKEPDEYLTHSDTAIQTVF